MRIARPLHRHTAMPVGEVYIHQTAGRDPVHEFPTGDNDPGDAFRALNEYAINGKGYSAVDYSILVHTGPSLRTTIGIARGEYVPAATLHRNTESKAICLLGWFGPPDPRYPWTKDHARVPLPQELEAIADAIVFGIHEGWIRRDAKILGHRDNPEHPNATACPGDYLQAALPTIRALVAERLNPPKPGPTPPPTDPTEDDMTPEYFNVAPDRLNQSAALFARVGTIVQYVGVDQWVALGTPFATRVASRAECKRYHLVTPAPTSHRGIWANA